MEFDLIVNKLVVDVDEIVQYDIDLSLNANVPTSVDVSIQDMYLNDLMQINVNKDLHVEKNNNWKIQGTVLMNNATIKQMLKQGLEEIDLNMALSIKKYIEFYHYLWIQKVEQMPDININKILQEVHWSFKGLNVQVTQFGFDVLADISISHPIPIEMHIPEASTDVYLGYMHLGRGGVTNLAISSTISHVEVFLNLESSWKSVQRYVSNESNAIGLLNNATLAGPVLYKKNNKVIQWLKLATEDLQVHFGLTDLLKTFLTGFMDIKAFLKTIDVIVKNSEKELLVNIKFPFKAEVNHFHLSKAVSFSVYYKDIVIVKVTADPDLSDKKVNLELTLEFFNFESLGQVAYDLLITKALNGNELIKDIYIGNVQFGLKDCEWCQFMMKDFKLSLDFLGNIGNSDLFEDIMSTVKSLIVIHNIDSTQSNNYSGFDCIAHISISEAFHSLSVDLDNVFISALYKSEFVHLVFDHVRVGNGKNDIPLKVPFLHNSVDFSQLVHQLLYVSPPTVYINKIHLYNIHLDVPLPIDLKWFFSKVILSDYIRMNLTSIHPSYTDYNSFNTKVDFTINSYIPLNVKTNPINIELLCQKLSLFKIGLTPLHLPIGLSQPKLSVEAKFGNITDALATEFVDGLLYNYEPPSEYALTSLLLQGPHPVTLFQHVYLPYKLQESLNGITTVSTKDLVTPLHDLGLELHKASVIVLPNKQLLVHIQFKVDNPLPITLDIPAVDFQLGIGDTAILVGTLNPFHIQPHQFLFSASITLSFLESSNVKECLQIFMDNVFNNRDNLPVWVNHIALNTEDSKATHLLNELVFKFSRFLNYSGKQLIDYLYRTRIQIHQISIAYTDEFVIDLMTSIILPFEFELDIPLIQLDIDCKDNNSSTACMRVQVKRLKMSQSGTLHVFVKFMQPISTIPTSITIRNLSICYSSIDCIYALKSVQLSNDLSNLSPLVSLPKVNVDKILNALIKKINNPIALLSQFRFKMINNHFKLFIPRFLNLYFPVSLDIPDISIVLQLNDKDAISLNINRFLVKNGKINSILVSGELLPLNTIINIPNTLPSIALYRLKIRDMDKLQFRFGFSFNKGLLSTMSSYFASLKYIGRPLINKMLHLLSLNHLSIKSIQNGLSITPSFKYFKISQFLSPVHTEIKINMMPIFSIILQDSIDVIFHPFLLNSLSSPITISITHLQLGTSQAWYSTIIEATVPVSMDNFVKLIDLFKSISLSSIPFPLLSNIKFNQHSNTISISTNYAHPYMKYFDIDPIHLLVDSNLVSLNILFTSEKVALDIEFISPSITPLSGQLSINHRPWLKIENFEFSIPVIHLSPIIPFLVPYIPMITKWILNLVPSVAKSFQLYSVFALSQIDIKYSLKLPFHIDTIRCTVSYLSTQYDIEIDPQSNVVLSSSSVPNLNDIQLSNLSIGSITLLKSIVVVIEPSSVLLIMPIVPEIINQLNLTEILSAVLQLVSKIHLQDTFIQILNPFTFKSQIKMSMPFEFKINVQLFTQQPILTMDAQKLNDNLQSTIQLSNSMQSALDLYNLEPFTLQMTLGSVFLKLPINLSSLSQLKVALPSLSVDTLASKLFDAFKQQLTIQQVSLTQSNAIDLVVDYLAPIHVEAQLEIHVQDAPISIALSPSRLRLHVNFKSLYSFKDISLGHLLIGSSPLFSLYSLHVNPSSLLPLFQSIKYTLPAVEYTFKSTTIESSIRLQSEGTIQLPIAIQLSDIEVSLAIDSTPFGHFLVEQLLVKDNTFYISLSGQLINSDAMSHTILSIYTALLHQSKLLSTLSLSKLKLGTIDQLQDLKVSIPLASVVPNNTQLRYPQISLISIHDVQLDVIKDNSLTIIPTLSIQNPFPVSINISDITAIVNINDIGFTKVHLDQLVLKSGLNQLKTSITCYFTPSMDLTNELDSLVKQVLSKTLTSHVSVTGIIFNHYTLIQQIPIQLALSNLPSMPTQTPYITIDRVNGEVHKDGLLMTCLFTLPFPLKGSLTKLGLEIQSNQYKVVQLAISDLQLQGQTDVLISLDNYQELKQIWTTSTRLDTIKIELTGLLIGNTQYTLNVFESMRIHLEMTPTKQLIGYFSLQNLFKLRVNVYVPFDIPFPVEINFHQFYVEAWDYKDATLQELSYKVATINGPYVYKSSDKGCRIQAIFTGSFLKLGSMAQRLNQVKGIKEIKVFHPLYGEIQWITKLKELGLYFKGEFRLRDPSN